MSYTEQEYDEFEKRMKERFPKMFSKPYGGFAVGKGWWPILESLCANIQSHIDHIEDRRKWIETNRPGEELPEKVIQVTVAQIKEKFGGLRFYYDGGDEVISGMVRMAESWADKSCEVCGAPGTRRSGGWIRTLCDHHEEEHQRKQKEYDED